MPITYFEGFDDITTETELVNKGWLAFGGSNFGILGTNRHGTAGGGIFSRHGTNAAVYQFPTAVDDVIVGFAYFRDTQLGTADYNIIDFRTDNGTNTLSLRAMAAGGSTYTINIYKNGNATLLHALPIIFQQQWYYFEIRARFTVGQEYLEFRVNGLPVYTSTGLTWPASTINRAAWNSNSSVYIYLDDMYMINNSDGIGFLGNVRIPYVIPNADTVQRDFTPNSGPTNYTQVDETSTIDNDTTYVSSSASGARDLLELNSLPVYTRTGICGIKPIVYVKNQSDAAAIREVMKSGTTVTTGTSKTITDTTTYKPYHSMGAVRLNPDTNLPWTEADITNLQIGYEVT